MNEVRDVLRLTIGPLHYEFHAHDAWGVDALDRLRANVVVVDFPGAADRVLHLADLGMTRDENDQINRDWLPDRYAALLPEDAPRDGWRLTGDETGHMTFRHDRSHHSLFVFGVFPPDYFGPFQLPWPAMLEDIIARGGGILHGGLIAQNGRGLILTAPPGGGKTTAIGRLPAEWPVLADDASLVWSDAEGGFLASPLPTWSVLLGRTPALPAIRRWEIGTVVPVSGIVLLHKGQQDRLTSLPALQSIPALYRAMSEHPRVIKNGEPYRTHLFDVAHGLARAVRIWRLDATLAARFWEHLPSVASEGEHANPRVALSRVTS